MGLKISSQTSVLPAKLPDRGVLDWTATRLSQVEDQLSDISPASEASRCKCARLWTPTRLSQRLGIQKVKKYGTRYEAVAKGGEPGRSASLDCSTPAQHEPQIVASGPSHALLKNTISNDAEESGEEHGDMQAALLDLNRQDDFRLSFLRKLSYKKVWVPVVHRSPKHQTVIIFDWDDTLLCTHFLSLQRGSFLPSAVLAHLRSIEKASKRLLEKSLQLGYTFIITNAMEGWVEHSAALFVPGLLPVLQKIRIISARSKYEGANPSDVRQWKISAFMELQKELDLPVVTNLNAIGDSQFEMDAARIMGGEFEQALVKTIKFRQNPSSEELAKQLKLVEHKFESIVQMAQNLTICLEQYSQ